MKLLGIVGRLRNWGYVFVFLRVVLDYLDYNYEVLLKLNMEMDLRISF